MTAEASPSGSPLAPGYKLDRYELLCPIAEGGMASVWVARQSGKHGFEKLVAIKTILPKFAADLRFQEMFLDEARIASRIEHLNVAQILDLGEEQEILYLAMEYVDGDAISKLNRACQKKSIRIPIGIAMRLLADTCAGLHEAHELTDSTGRPLEIVHRDVSPHNILVSTKGIAKLIDFGIAKARTRVGSDTSSGVLKGKIQYMAPEQALGRPVDRRADVWAIGSILYHLIAGKPPYEGDNQLATLHLLGSGRPPVPLPQPVHPAVAAVVRNALAYAPENRYATAAELRAALEEAMVAAAVPTTLTDVAAFSTLHLSERAERRRQAIDLAVAGAAERRRQAGQSNPGSDRSLATARTPQGALQSLVSPYADPLAQRNTITVSEAQIPEPPPSDAVVRLTARVSEPPVATRSYPTLGSTALVSSKPVPTQKPRPLALVTGIAVAAVAVAGVSATLLMPTRREELASPSAATAPAPSAESLTIPGPSTGTAAALTSVASVPTGIPTVAASSLPKVPPKVPAYAPPARWQPPTSTTIAPVKPKPKVDDGF